MVNMNKHDMKNLTIKHIMRTMIAVLLFLAGGMTYSAWAAKVTYHILTLPMDSDSDRPGKTQAIYDGWRVEAVKVVVDNATTPDLPEHYKSPLANNFQYYAASSIETYSSGTEQKIYDNSANKYVLYKVKDGESALAAEYSITSNCDIYVTYDYNA